jgi:hypothetical protein
MTPQFDSYTDDVGRTNINNNNYTINNNNNDYSLSPFEEEQTILGSLHSGVASLRSSAPQDIPVALPHLLSERVVAAPAQEANVIVDNSIPENWDYIKLDLFDNCSAEDLVKGKTKLKVALNIKKAGQTNWSSFNAGLNSPIRSMKRNLDGATWDGDHYMLVRETYKDLKEIYKDVRVSKFYEKGYKGKGSTVEQLSVIVCQEELIGHYIVALFFGTNLWCWKMRGDKGYLTQSQRNKNMIATVGIRRGNKIKNKNALDLL